MASDRVNKSELYGIQMLRGVAALAVVVHHALEQSNGSPGRFSPEWLTTAGASGVDIFFVISGFIMLHVSFRPARPTPTPGDFLFRRATRIYPLYWACCLAILLISSLGFLASHRYSAPGIAKSFLLAPGGTIIGVAWTLTYEVYFYLLFAMTLWLRSALWTVVGTSAAIAILFLCVPLMPAGDIAEFLINPLPVEFCMGLGLAYAYSHVLRLGRPWPVHWAVGILGFAVLALAPLIVAHPDTHGLTSFPRVLAWGIPAVLVVASGLTVPPPRNAIARFTVLLGDASYALYLTHVFVMIGYGRLLKTETFGHLPQWPIVTIVTIVAIALGLAVHMLVEKPLLALIRRYAHRDPGHVGSRSSVV